MTRSQKVSLVLFTLLLLISGLAAAYDNYPKAIYFLLLAFFGIAVSAAVDKDREKK